MVVEQSCTEGRAVLCDGLVCSDKLVDLAGCRVGEEVCRQVRAYLGCRCEIWGEEPKECALVFLVADDKGDFGVFTGCNESVRRGGDSLAVGPREIREIHGKVSKDSGNGVAGLQEFGVGGGA
jgi:hypothetical protein